MAKVWSFGVITNAKIHSGALNKEDCQEMNNNRRYLYIINSFRFFLTNYLQNHSNHICELMPLQWLALLMKHCLHIQNTRGCTWNYMNDAHLLTPLLLLQLINQLNHCTVRYSSYVSYHKNSCTIIQKIWAKAVIKDRIKKMCITELLFKNLKKKTIKSIPWFWQH